MIYLHRSNLFSLLWVLVFFIMGVGSVFFVYCFTMTDKHEKTPDIKKK